MTSCWENVPEDRPTFDDCKDKVGDYLERIGYYFIQGIGIEQPTFPYTNWTSIQNSGNSGCLNDLTANELSCASSDDVFGDSGGESVANVRVLSMATKQGRDRNWSETVYV